MMGWVNTKAEKKGTQYKHKCMFHEGIATTKLIIYTCIYINIVIPPLLCPNLDTKS